MTGDELKAAAEGQAKAQGTVSCTYTYRENDADGNEVVSRSATWTRGIDPDTF
ncbi:hypothetical protein [Nocardia sp. NPDC050435]|uniref:hypothetical protein n=1 Tax=Nocardia sp. NPDC050435 TaxID=3155040 RepID=UPI0033DCD036